LAAKLRVREQNAKGKQVFLFIFLQIRPRHIRLSDAEGESLKLVSVNFCKKAIFVLRKRCFCEFWRICLALNVTVLVDRQRQHEG